MNFDKRQISINQPPKLSRAQIEHTLNQNEQLLQLWQNLQNSKPESGDALAYKKWLQQCFNCKKKLGESLKVLVLQANEQNSTARDGLIRQSSASSSQSSSSQKQQVQQYGMPSINRTDSVTNTFPLPYPSQSPQMPVNTSNFLQPSGLSQSQTAGQGFSNPYAVSATNTSFQQVGSAGMSMAYSSSISYPNNNRPVQHSDFNSSSHNFQYTDPFLSNSVNTGNNALNFNNFNNNANAAHMATSSSNLSTGAIPPHAHSNFYNPS